MNLALHLMRAEGLDRTADLAVLVQLDGDSPVVFVSSSCAGCGCVLICHGRDFTLPPMAQFGHDHGYDLLRESKRRTDRRRDKVPRDPVCGRSRGSAPLSGTAATAAVGWGS